MQFERHKCSTEMLTVLLDIALCIVDRHSYGQMFMVLDLELKTKAIRSCNWYPFNCNERE